MRDAAVRWPSLWLIFDFSHLFTIYDWQSRWHKSPTLLCSFLLSLPTANRDHCHLLPPTQVFLLWLPAFTQLKISHQVHLLVLRDQTIHHIGELVGRWGRSVTPSKELLSSHFWKRGSAALLILYPWDIYSNKASIILNVKCQNQTLFQAACVLDFSESYTSSFTLCQSCCYTEQPFRA